jgi:hypothetical protein
MNPDPYRNPNRNLVPQKGLRSRLRLGLGRTFKNGQPDATVDRLNMGVRNRSMPCDFMVVTESVLQRKRNHPGLIYREILTHGKEVYAV